jgi:hypothetical protein
VEVVGSYQTVTYYLEFHSKCVTYQCYCSAHDSLSDVGMAVLDIALFVDGDFFETGLIIY